jgi:hypothetical protein
MLTLTFTLLWLANKIETAMNYTGAAGRPVAAPATAAVMDRGTGRP